MRGVTSFHINTAECIKAENTITHRTVDGDVVENQPFLQESMIWESGDDGKRTKNPLRVGVTSGASTPDKEVQDALGRNMFLIKTFFQCVLLGFCEGDCVRWGNENDRKRKMSL